MSLKSLALLLFTNQRPEVSTLHSECSGIKEADIIFGKGENVWW